MLQRPVYSSRVGITLKISHGNVGSSCAIECGGGVTADTPSTSNSIGRLGKNLNEIALVIRVLVRWRFIREFGCFAGLARVESRSSLPRRRSRLLTEPYAGREVKNGLLDSLASFVRQGFGGRGDIVGAAEKILNVSHASARGRPSSRRGRCRVVARPVFSSSPTRFVKTLEMLATEHFATHPLGATSARGTGRR